MAAAKNTQTTKDGEDNQLILYRLDRVEAKVDEVGAKLDRQDTIKRSDLKDFQEIITTRFLERSADLQKQIDDIKDHKANNSDLQDTKKVMYSVIGFGFSVLLALMGFLLSKV